MSADFLVLAVSGPITVRQAEQIWEQFDEGLPESDDPDDRIVGFYQELTARFPALEELSGDHIDDSPWSQTPVRSSGHVLMHVVWSKADEMADQVTALAEAYRLVCDDPQLGRIHNPPQPAEEGRLRLQFCDGGAASDPRPGDLAELLQELSERNWYAILERERTDAGPEEGWYIQTGLGSNADAPAGQFRVEFREGTADHHHSTVVAHLSEVVTAFEGYATGDPAWKSAYTWTPGMP